MNVITIAPFYTASGVNHPNTPRTPQAYINKTREMLKAHNIAIELAETGDFAGVPCMLEWNQSIDLDKNVGDIRALCEPSLPFGNAIPVIFGIIYQAEVYGAAIPTDYAGNGGKRWPPYIVINLQLQSRFNAVLLHELIHAAYFSKAYLGKPMPDHDANPTSIFAACAPDKNSDRSLTQNFLPALHVAALRSAAFATFRA